MYKRHLILFWIILFLAGCANPFAPPTLSVRQTPVLTATNPPTITPTLAPERTSTPEIRFTRQCLPVQEQEIALNEVALGTILVSWTGPSVEYYEALSALNDLQTGNEYPLPSSLYSERSGFISSEISPDQKMYAKLEALFDRDRGVPGRRQIGNAVQVFDVRANLVAKLTFNRTDLVWLHWLDNERLIIDTEKYGTLLLVNPFTGEQQMIADELPDLKPYELNKKNFPWWPVVYSPDLELVAYYSEYKEGDNYRSGTVLYNLVSKQILWKKDEGVSPAWSSDGKVLAFTTVGYEGQLYLFSRPGPVKVVLDESLPHKARVLSWSPDGRYIAFWNAESLMIYDRQMEWVFDTCISSKRDTVSPLWAPDSRHMIVYVSGYSTPIMLVNWEEKMAYKIKELPHDGTLHGWMSSIQ